MSTTNAIHINLCRDGLVLSNASGANTLPVMRDLQRNLQSPRARDLDLNTHRGLALILCAMWDDNTDFALRMGDYPKHTANFYLSLLLQEQPDHYDLLVETINRWVRYAEDLIRDYQMDSAQRNRILAQDITLASYLYLAVQLTWARFLINHSVDCWSEAVTTCQHALAHEP